MKGLTFFYALGVPTRPTPEAGEGGRKNTKEKQVLGILHGSQRRQLILLQRVCEGAMQRGRRRGGKESRGVDLEQQWLKKGPV